MITFEELKNSPRETLRKAFQFLEIDDTYLSPQHTSVLNSTATKFRTNKLGDLLISKNSLLRPLTRLTGKLLPVSLRNRARSMMGSKQSRPVLDSETRETLQSALREDIAKFRELTGRSFEEWSV